MAQFVPTFDDSLFKDEAERTVGEAIRDQFSDDWWVFTNLNFISETRDADGPHDREHETDFVLFHTRQGLFILEVKGHRKVRYRERSGQHVIYDNSRGRHLELEGNRNPITQGTSNHHQLAKRIQERVFNGRRFDRADGGLSPLPLPYTFGAIFPCGQVRGVEQDQTIRRHLFDQSDVPELHDRVATALAAAAQPVPGLRVNRDEAAAIVKTIGNWFSVDQSLRTSHQTETRRIDRLTEQQREVMRQARRNARLAVEGVAGSGKTVLATQEALHLAEEGGRVLLTCYNENLAARMARTLGDAALVRTDPARPVAKAGQVTVAHFHQLAFDLAKKAGIPFDVPADDDDHEWFFRDETPNILVAAAERLPDQRFDAIIIDEGQDFTRDWVDACETLLAHPNPPPVSEPRGWESQDELAPHEQRSRLIFFYDRCQAMYENRMTPDVLLRFDTSQVLEVNCRNSRAIAEFCSEIIQQPIRTRREAVPGRPITAPSPGRSAADRCDQVREWLDRWITEEGLSPSSVAILTPYHRSNQDGCLGERSELGSHRLVHTIEQWEAGHGVLVATIKSFKGLESDALLLVDLPPVDSHPVFRTGDYYVACSRAKLDLTILSAGS